MDLSYNKEIEMIFGREKIIKRIMKILETISIIFVAERRVGKTVVLKELQKCSNDSRIIIFLDVEDVKSPIEFVRQLYEKLSTQRKVFGKANRSHLWQSINGSIERLESKGFKLNKGKDKLWKILLNNTISEVCKNINGQLILLFDEIPYMLQNIRLQEKTNGINDNTALEILDTLRKLRQTEDNLRMIFTGSIGLHHVVADIGKGLSTNPLSVMERVELEPLSNTFALKMAKHHVKKEDILIEDDKIIKSLISQCDNVPFYIEKVIRRLSILEGKLTQKEIDNEIEIIITDANDLFEMSHYRTRLQTYYLSSKQLSDGQVILHEDIVLSLLNNLASTTERMSIDDCHNNIKSQYPIDDRKLIILLLASLAKDYYIKSDTDMKYQFTFTLIKRWWIKNQGLLQSKKQD